MNMARKAAEAKLGIWHGHDQRDQDLVRLSASRFYEILTESSDEELDYTAEMTRRAFWLADEAEKYQGEDEELEEHFYSCVENLLEEAFESVGLPTEMASDRINWWRSYRHGDDLREDVRNDLNYIMDDVESDNVDNFIIAAAEHNSDPNKSLENLEELYTEVIN